MDSNTIISPPMTEKDVKVTTYEYEVIYHYAFYAAAHTTKSIVTTLREAAMFNHLMKSGFYVGEHHITPGAILSIRKVKTNEGNIEL